MKYNITISLDEEIVKKLKEEINYSDVINEQMKGFYAVKTCENVEILNNNLAKTKQILKENRKIRRDIEEQLDKIATKKKKIKNIMKKKGITKAQLIKKIEQRRHLERHRIRYFESVESEAERLLKGGVK